MTGPRRIFLFTVFVTFGFLAVEFSFKGSEIHSAELNPGRRKVLADEPKYDLEKLLLRQEQRRKEQRSACQLAYNQVHGWQRKGLNTSSMDHLIADDKYRLMYCYIPKVACTNWKRTLMVLTGKSNATDPLAILADTSHRPQHWHTLINFTKSESISRLQTYHKFMFVRHPFERLVSAYVNKFHKNYSDYFRTRYGRTIVKNYRLNATNEALARGHDVTFSEFVEYLVDPKTVEKTPLNEHWRPMHELCRPCHIKYDTIGKYETLAEDAWLVLKQVGVSHLVEFPKVEINTKTKALVTMYLNQLTKKQILRLYRVYELDFRLFNYNHGKDNWNISN